MKNFKIIFPELLKDSSAYEKIEDGIYKSVKSGGYVVAMSMEMEDGDDSQYPLEDILDKYLVHIEEFLDTDDPNKPKYVFEGDLDGAQGVKSLVGKRVFNEEYEADDGRRLIKLSIEPI